ncbi:hypothetical protein FE810_00680 [Thalassotalea litorea]|uniref:YcxB family protein n=1 Tax=Thalassotalea litorea TaxID=2020715 RepID=A0A5R9ISM1_9GAMM|nr:hypothetical protein [Thalassotalea litorea]TLU67503.1 hypothetical protein FE810_00680 [Thalassotalea litorea]
MEIVQSRFQNVFSRLYVMMVHIFWYVVIGIPASIFFSTSIDIIFFIKISLAFTSLFIIYLWLLHPEPSKKIVMNENGFDYYDYQMKREVDWRGFKGYKITKSIPYRVIIELETQENIEFSYYTFSSNQREMLFDLFKKKQS